MLHLEDWIEVRKGFYTYKAADDLEYEIVVTYHADNTPWMTARADLYFVAHYDDHMERKKIASCLPVQYLIKAACEDFAVISTMRAATQAEKEEQSKREIIKKLSRDEDFVMATDRNLLREHEI